jgi:hypothetical protein
MSQNGPYPGQGWPAGGSSGSDEPYTEPADPWGDVAAQPAPDSAWGGHPMSMPPGPQDSAGYHGGYLGAPMNDVPPMWQAPVPPPRRRNTPIIALVVVLGLLILGGLATAGWLLQHSATPQAGASKQPTAASSATTGSVPEPQSSEDARFVAKGQCVRNEGTADDSPDLKIVSCASGTYQVLKRVDGRTTGEADAEAKCSKVSKYTKWYFYDSELDSLDFVLCLREYGSN